ncbi:nuclear pore complex protein Nup107-like [Tropilaelaps mercedesae]|uniref:Nuclear pore complex protein n=1 Tax=Tropilaelaps mercedesae TaxID=418985 RepID=A0A1V9XME9_9ACAR|nr:nuclear pore complex protein Nup107-like [Tropilaelaps mercedesae]
MATRSPDEDRSVYAALFESTAVGRAQGGLSSSLHAAETSVNNVTLLLPDWVGEQTVNNSNVSALTRGQTSALLTPVSRDVHSGFSDALYSMGRNEIFLVDPEPLVKQYATLSEDFEKQLRDLIANRAVGPGETRDLIDFFHNEKFTWKLVWALLTASQGNDSIDNLEDIAELRLPNSDAEEIDDLFDCSFDFRKAQTLVDWLEHRYGEERCASNTASLHAYKEHGGMYEATLHAILSNRANADVVSELDPDAPIRQQRVLHEQDIEDEQRFFRCVFELVRAGKLTEAQKLAMDQGYFMLAAGMEGWKAFRGNIRDEEGNLMPDEGNPYRDVWKAVVWKKLADDRVNAAEKAIYAALSGCLEALLPLCSNWEDYLWAHLKTMVDVAIELHLRNVRGADIGRLPEEYPKENESLDQVLKNLENRPELKANDFFRQLHKFLMLQDANGLLTMMYDRCVKLVEEDNRTSQRPSHQLRLMANLALFLRYHRQEVTQTAADSLNDPVNHIGRRVSLNAALAVESMPKTRTKIPIFRFSSGSSCGAFYVAVAFYVDRLIVDGIHEVVPRYVLHLPGKLRERCYLTFLRALRNPTEDQRRAVIEGAQREGIDIYDYLTKFVYETIHQGIDPAADGVHGVNVNEINESDLQNIDALKWLFVQRGRSLLGLRYVNSALRSAILGRRLQVARKLIALVSAEDARELAFLVVDRSQDSHLERGESLATGRNRSQLSRASSDEYMDSDSTINECVDPAKVKKALKEYFCFQVYIEAQHSFTEWFEQFHRNKPKPLENSVNDSSARSALTAEFAKKSLESRLEAWQTILNGLCERTTGHLYSILSYQDGGFLQDPCEQEVPDNIDQSILNQETRRIEELRALRRLCLPEVVSLLHTVLHGTGRYAEAIEIANLVASEALCLYKEFSKEDMAALLIKIQESSVELLKTPGTIDPYGIEDV